eukprot:c27109_g1_i1.p1 GENE.c27109_g1_i1~~c27109_g1_i1.p1  ORF type:complete len:189 (-),score=11.33 c27109_g1_i1:188-754(-)
MSVQPRCSGMQKRRTIALLLCVQQTDDTQMMRIHDELLLAPGRSDEGWEIALFQKQRPSRVRSASDDRGSTQDGTPLTGAHEATATLARSHASLLDCQRGRLVFDLSDVASPSVRVVWYKDAFSLSASSKQVAVMPECRANMPEGLAASGCSSADSHGVHALGSNVRKLLVDFRARFSTKQLRSHYLH